MNIERLRKLQRKLRTKTVQEHFDLAIWANDKFRARLRDGKPLAPDCGAAACAMGWAVTIFPDLLKLRGGAPVLKKQHKGWWIGGTQAAAEVFGIPQDTAWLLFMPGEYPARKRGPLDVADRIGQVITYYRMYERFPDNQYQLASMQKTLDRQKAARAAK